MRPKKTILLIVADELRLSVWRYLLETRGYRVFGAGDSVEAGVIFCSRVIDVVVCELEIGPIDGGALIAILKTVRDDVPMILISETVAPGERADCADAFLDKRHCTPVELVERVRIMAQRKRGPKKQPRPVCPAIAEASVA